MLTFVGGRIACLGASNMFVRNYLMKSIGNDKLPKHVIVALLSSLQNITTFKKECMIRMSQITMYILPALRRHPKYHDR